MVLRIGFIGLLSARRVVGGDERTAGNAMLSE
jgi:hypothetical protein